MIIFNLKNVLEDRGIATTVRNEYASGGAGDLAPFETWPELWINDDQHFDRAASLLREILDSNQEKFWYCQGCQEKNDAAFEICWNCGREAE